MSIRKRLILSNVAMILIPVIAFFVIEIFLSILLFHILGEDPEGNQKKFLQIRYFLFIAVLIITNALLTYSVSKSILKPIEKLSIAAHEISKGNLDFPIKPMSRDELGKLSETFELMRMKLKESADMQMKYEENRKELIASISHDLKTPITSIKGYVEGIRDGVANTPEKMERYIQTIYTKSLDMDHLIDELFLYSKLDLNREPFQFEEVDLRCYFLDFMEELQYELEKDHIAVSVHANENETYKVVVDREQLKRVAMNIIHNSLKHLDKEKKTLHIYLSVKDEMVVTQIQDNGNGISEEALPYIFERFYRADQARNTQTGGTGLGLAIVKRIIEQHGGEIWAESKVGEGTSITFTLKRA
ncbi:sensor histidine kinase [Ferdinandcohnia sp. Marseille-Q9671]